MKRKELIALIEEGENLRVEFKLKFSTPEKIAKEMIAFANTKGGFVIFGVDDNRNVVGVESEKGEAEMIIQAAEEFCEPPLKYILHYIEVYGNEIVIAEIPESLNKPHRLQDYDESFDLTSAVVYVRINDKSVQASKELIKLLKTTSTSLRKYQISFVEEKIFEHLEKHEIISVKEISSLCNISGRRASRALINLVRAGMLFIHSKENGENYFTASV